MNCSKEITKIRKFGLISFILPLIAINSCLLLFKFLGKLDLYFDYDYDRTKVEYTIKQHQKIAYDEKAKTFTNCPKYELETFFITHKGKKIITNKKKRKGGKKGKRIKIDITDIQTNTNLSKKLLISPTYLNFIESGKRKIDLDLLLKISNESNVDESDILGKYQTVQQDTKDFRCIRNYPVQYFILKKFPKLEKIFIEAKFKSITGFGHVKNPYLYGEVSISRTARYYPATLLFKPLIVLSAIFLFLYWRNNLNLLNKIKNNNNLKDFSKSFFYLGVLSCIFLTIHAIFLGIDFDSKLFKLFRRLVITFFIFFEIFAQIFLVKNLYNYKNEIKNLIYPVILNSKIIFVIIMLITTLISFAALGANIVEDNFKHVLEWNYFSILLIYYFLSRIMWKAPKKNQAHTPFGA